MGYCTQFSLSWEEKAPTVIEQDPLIEEIKSKMGDKAEEILKKMNIKEKTLDDAIKEYFESDPNCYFYTWFLYPTENYKWYEHEDDMKALSKHFPNVFFTLEGEDSEDMWKKYFYNGKMQVAEAVVTFAEPDWEYLNETI